jgi:hypothetical protein
VGTETWHLKNRALPKYDHTTVSIRVVHMKSLSCIQPFQESTKGLRFRFDKDVEVVVVKQYQQQPKKFFLEGRDWLLHLWDACFSTHGDYF